MADRNEFQTCTGGATSSGQTAAARPHDAGGAVLRRNPALDAAFEAIERAKLDLADAAASILSVPEPAPVDLGGGRIAARTVAAGLAGRLDGGIAALARLRTSLATEMAALDRDGVDEAMLAGIGDRLAAIATQAEEHSRRLAAGCVDERGRLAELAAALGIDESAGLAVADPALVERAVARLSARAGRGSRVSVLLLGFDRLEWLDAEHGPGTAMLVLAAAARAIEASFTDLGSVYRHRDEVFAAVLPATSLRQAVAVGEHLRRLMIRKILVRRSSGAELGRLTLSIGAATLQAGEDPAGLLMRADACLGAARWSGGNRVVCETDPEIGGRRSA